jgi:GT2 family glycosyltransferase
MAERITIAIVVPTYGRVDALRRLLDSIAAQRVAPSELIVVDQNPSGFLDGVVPPEAQHIRLNTPNAATARNVGFLASRATHVTFIDDDQVLDREHVSRLIDTFTAHPHVHCIWPVLRHASDAPQPRGTSLVRVRRAGSGGVAFERSLFRDLGGYDDLLFEFAATGEDWELSLRMKGEGVEVWCDPALVIVHSAEEHGGCAIRSVPYEVARGRVNRSIMLGLRLHGGPGFRLRLRDLPTIVRYTLLSSLGRPDARRAVLRHPLRHLRMIADAMRASRAFVRAHAARYEGGWDHLRAIADD